jgi:hypothetical protein
VRPHLTPLRARRSSKRSICLVLVVEVVGGNWMIERSQSSWSSLVIPITFAVILAISTSSRGNLTGARRKD